MKLHEQLEPSVARIRDSLAGRASRVQGDGLGFDQTRLGSLSDKTSQSGSIRLSKNSRSLVSLCYLYVAPEPIGDWTAAPMLEGGRGGGGRPQGVGMHAAFTGLHGVSRLIVPASTRSWMPGTQSEIPHGFE